MSFSRIGSDLKETKTIFYALNKWLEKPRLIAVMRHIRIPNL
jgi:hypothetical protein